MADLDQWHGLDGMRELYETIGRMLGILPRVQAVLDEEEARIRPLLAKSKQVISGRRFCLITNSFSALPELIKCYEADDGVPLRHILLIPNPNFQRDFAVDSVMMERLYGRIREAMELYHCHADLTVDPSAEQMQKIIDDSEFLICGSHPRYARFGKPVMPGFLDRVVFDYDSFAEVAAEFAARVRQKEPPGHLLLNRMEYDPVFYPLRTDDSNTWASREMYTRMWRLRKR